MTLFDFNVTGSLTIQLPSSRACGLYSHYYYYYYYYYYVAVAVAVTAAIKLGLLLVFSFSVRYQEELLKRLAKLSRGWHAVSALVFEHD